MEENSIKHREFYYDLNNETPDIETYEINFVEDNKNLTSQDIYKKCELLFED